MEADDDPYPLEIGSFGLKGVVVRPQDLATFLQKRDLL
jgi:hypothetical protein